MKQLKDFILESKGGISLNINENTFYEILNALHFYYNNNDDLEKDDKNDVAKVYKIIWDAANKAKIEIDNCYTSDGDIKKVRFDY